jgi:hypothetical protein
MVARGDRKPRCAEERNLALVSVLGHPVVVFERQAVDARADLEVGSRRISWSSASQSS